jgi:hypothetical protein
MDQEMSPSKIAEREMNDDWTTFPLDNPQTTCGLRTDLPKKERAHQFIPLGLDIRNMGSAGFTVRDIFACQRCGKDQTKEPIAT